MQVVGVLRCRNPLDRQRRLETDSPGSCRPGTLQPARAAGQRRAIWESGPGGPERPHRPTTPPAGDEQAALEASVGELAQRPSTRNGRSGSFIWSGSTGRGARSSCASTTASPTASRFQRPPPLTDATPRRRNAPAAPTGGTGRQLLRATLRPAHPQHDRQHHDIRRLLGQVSEPHAQPQQVFDYARASAALTLEIGKLTGLQDDSLTFLKGSPRASSGSAEPPLCPKTPSGRSPKHRHDGRRGAAAA